MTKSNGRAIGKVITGIERKEQHEAVLERTLYANLLKARGHTWEEVYCACECRWPSWCKNWHSLATLCLRFK